MKKVFTVLLALVILTGLLPALATYGEETDVKVTLTKVGTVDAGALQNARYYETGICVISADQKYQLLDYQGNNALGETYDYATEFENGAWLVYQADKGRNAWGLVKPDGTVLIPVSAAIITKLGGSTRFLEVVYATEKVSDESAAYLKGAASPFLADQGDPEYYAGYSLYFDLENGKFIGDLKRTDITETYAVDVVGDKLYFRHREMVYDANGGEFAPFTDSTIGNFFVTRKGDGEPYQVYDDNMKEVAAFEKRPEAIYAGGQFFAFEDEETDNVILRTSGGAKLGELAFQYAPNLYGSFFCGNDTENSDVQIAMDLSGKTIITAEEGVSYIDEAPCGYLELTYEDGTYGLMRPDGTILKGGNLDGLLLYEERDQGYAMMILNTGTFMELPDDFSRIRSPFLFATEKDEVSTLYDVFNGEALLASNASWDAFYYANGYLYAKQGDSYEIYQVAVSD